MKVEFLCTDLRKILKYQISWNSTQWEPSCSMQAIGQTDGQTDVKAVIIAFRNLKIIGLHPSKTWRHWGCYASQHGVMPQKTGIFIRAAVRTLLLAQQFYSCHEPRVCGSKQERERKLQPEQGANNCGERRPVHRTEPLCSVVPHVSELHTLAVCGGSLAAPDTVQRPSQGSSDC
jgi:hypothetical protein